VQALCEQLRVASFALFGVPTIRVRNIDDLLYADERQQMS